MKLNLMKKMGRNELCFLCVCVCVALTSVGFFLFLFFIKPAKHHKGLLSVCLP